MTRNRGILTANHLELVSK